MRKELITIKNVYKNYGFLEVLKGLSAEIFEGETLVILGRSGVGKSVLLRLIMGLEQPDKGEIFIEKKSVEDQGHSLPDKEIEMGMLFQSGALFDSLTIGENVAFPLTSCHGRKKFGALDEDAVRERVKRSLELVGLSGIERKMPSDLSGGMKRRVAMARLIVYKPQVLLYDEPTTGLDPVTSMQISELIATIQKELQATSIVVTHDISSALRVGDRLALHYDGQLAYVASKEDFIQSKHPLVTQFLDPFSKLKNYIHCESGSLHE